MSPPSSQPPQPIPPTRSAQNLKAEPKTVSPADRLVEIDRLLAAPLTGRPEESDQRVLLRAEREALVTSGQVAAQRATGNAAHRHGHGDGPRARLQSCRKTRLPTMVALLWFPQMVT